VPLSPFFIFFDFFPQKKYGKEEGSFWLQSKIENQVCSVCVCHTTE
jgi:hypothetical protein